MAIFLDSAKLEEIKKYMGMGIVRGVTTNPTIIAKDMDLSTKRDIKKYLLEIAAAIAPYPLSVEVTSNNKDQMFRQALEFNEWANNINIKITIHGPNGELDNLAVIHDLSKKGVLINATAMMSAQQCLLAAMAGAKFVSIFGGRVNNMGYNVCEEIRKLRKILDFQGLPAKIIVGSTREILNIIEWLEAGADIVTVIPDLLKGMIVHPYSKETVAMFLADAAKTKNIVGEKK